ncbi:MAG: nucleotidyltransferase family protein [Deltaproteobacteria bacterium]|nr:nucleotidyltransferase family protein [Deltaproteobacteria bacterium]
MRKGAVILAAGAGMRLGGVAKALLNAGGGRTFLSQILATAREVGLDRAIVVVGPPFGEQVAAHAVDLGAEVVINPQPERGMASSVALGFAAIAGTACDAAWLWPVDHPDVAAVTLRELERQLGKHSAVRPTVGGRGGHPPLITRELWPQLAACGDAPQGARSVLVESDMLDVEVNDDGCVRDVDTAIDLEKV